MKKFPEDAHSAYEWPYQPNSPKQTHHTRNSSREKSEKDQFEEAMIRSLQGIFCKGRYRSWVASQNKK